MQYLQDAVSEAQSPEEAARAQREAAEYQRPWLERNVPVMPPPHVAAATAAPDAKVASYTAEDLTASARSGQRQETKTMDVLSLKVGYSRDAQYALPAEVRCANWPSL